MVRADWKDRAILLAGLWFAAAPWMLLYDLADNPAVLYNHLAVGTAIALFSAGALARPEAWEEIVDFAIGIWTVASPWVLGYTGKRSPTMNAVLVGLLVAVLALWTAVERSRFNEQLPWHR